jgi:hypothetical protein
MSAAQPLAFLLAALALPLVLAYLHRRGRLRTTVSSTILFRIIAGETSPRRRSFARPRHLVSLVLMLLALLAGVHAVADVRAEAEQPRDFVVVLDTSTSMATRSLDGRTRLDEAMDRLTKLLSKMTTEDRVALVTTGSEVRIRTGLTGDHARILEIAHAQRIERCVTDREAEDCAAMADRALRVADALCRRSRAGAIMLVSDGVGLSVPDTQCPVHHVSVGRAGPNVGITGLSVREADALGLAEVYLQLTANGSPREAEVELRVDDTVVDVVPLDIPEGGQVEHLHRLELPPGELVVARLRTTAEDVLPDDDVATTPRGAGQRLSVLLVAETPRSFVAEALVLHPRVDLTVIRPDERPKTQGYDLLVLETAYEAGPLPQAPRLAAFGTPPEELGLEERGQFVAPEIVRWSLDHPLLRFVDLGELSLPRARTLVSRESERALVDSDEGILGAVTRWDDREVFYLGFEPSESDLVLRVGFVNLVANIVEWATPPPEPTSTESPGDAVDPAASALPASESRIDPPARLGGTVSGSLAATRSSRNPWRLLVLAALALIALEWLLPVLFVRRIGGSDVVVRHEGEGLHR